MFLHFFLGCEGRLFCLDGCARAWTLGVGREEVRFENGVSFRFWEFEVELDIGFG
jgi:hypothetical protein